MRLTDVQLNAVRTRGCVVVAGFLDRATLSAAQDALWQVFPTPVEWCRNAPAATCR